MATAAAAAVVAGGGGATSSLSVVPPPASLPALRTTELEAWGEACWDDVDVNDDDDGGGSYGADDEHRRLWHRPESLVAGWIVTTFLVALAAIVFAGGASPVCAITQLCGSGTAAPKFSHLSLLPLFSSPPPLQ